MKQLFQGFDGTFKSFNTVEMSDLKIWKFLKLFKTLIYYPWTRIKASCIPTILC